jgi:phosphorylcholine metabolism protein LicD
MLAQTQMPAQAQIPTQVQDQQPGQLTTQKKAKQKQKPPRNKYLWPENEDPERENKYMRGPQAYNSYPRPPFGPYGPHGPYSPYGPFAPGMRPSRRMQPAVGCAVM